jgi:hypothetical protein
MMMMRVCVREATSKESRKPCGSTHCHRARQTYRHLVVFERPERYLRSREEAPGRV